MDKQKINTDSPLAAQSSEDTRSQDDKDEVHDQYSSQAQNKTSFKDFTVRNLESLSCL